MPASGAPPRRGCAALSSPPPGAPPSPTVAHRQAMSGPALPVAAGQRTGDRRRHPRATRARATRLVAAAWLSRCSRPCCAFARSARRASGTTRRSRPCTCCAPRSGRRFTTSSTARTRRPLWYVLEWGVSRVLGTGAVALRLLSALAGIATVPVAWAIGRELQGPPTRRAAIVTAALVAGSPLLVWYSQEARAYALFVLCASFTLLCFLRALARAEHAASGGVRARRLAGAPHPLLRGVPVDPDDVVAPVGRGHPARAGRRGAPDLVGAALVPLILAQGGHGTQWIGEWALASRLEAIPQYYLTGYTGRRARPRDRAARAGRDPRGFRVRTVVHAHPREERGALIALTVAGVRRAPPDRAGGARGGLSRSAQPGGRDGPGERSARDRDRRPAHGVRGIGLAGLLVLGFVALTIDVNLSPRLQRGDWAGVADAAANEPTGSRDHDGRVGGGPARVLPPAARQSGARIQGHGERGRRDRLRSPAQVGRYDRPHRAFISQNVATSTA